VWREGGGKGVGWKWGRDSGRGGVIMGMWMEMEMRSVWVENWFRRKEEEGALPVVDS